jgi:glycosidase
MNHCSNQHPWFTASAAGDPTYADWFLWRGDNPGWTQPWGGGPVWHDGGSRGYYYGVFWSGMPDLNYTNPAVVQEMTDIADFWLQDMGADGFRLDAIKYLVEDGSTLEDTPATLAFWTDFSQQIAASHPEAYLVGEVYDETGIVLQYIDAGLQTCFDFDLAEGMIAAANAGSPGVVIAQFRQLVNLFPYHQYATFLTNHDQRRLYSQLGNNVGRNKVAAAMLLTLPGVPFLYYGEEVGMQSAWSPDEDKRRPMQWTAGANAGFTSGSPWYAVGSNYATNNVAVMRADENSLWNHYRTLVQTRARSTTLQRGTYHRLDVSNGALFAFLRHHEGDGVVAVHNLASGTIGGFSLSVPASQLAPGTYTAQDLVTGADLTGLTAGADGSIGDWRPTGFILGQSYLLVQLTPERRE